jgi:dTDP-4-amino-4,6-dideoxygalactose transaminase
MSIDLPVFRFEVAPTLTQALREAADRVIASKRYVLGPEVENFEREFAAFCGSAHCVGVANGTDALELALRAAGVSRGDRVVLTANAGCYAATAARAIGAEPVYVDVSDDLVMSVDGLDRVLTGASAVVVTHLYGRMAPIGEIAGIAGEAGVAVIEDCAQAHGAASSGRHAGTFGAAGCFSFYPTKNLGALGDGGAVITSDAQMASRLRALRQYGWSTKYRIEHAGGRNSRLDELQAAFLRTKLPHLPAWNAARVAIALRYCNGLRGLPLRLPDCPGDEYVAHLFVIRCADRRALRSHLAEAGIGTEIHYPAPDYAQPTDRVDGDARPLSMTESACREVLSLPCYPGMTDADVDRVITSIRAHYSRR